LTLPVAPSATGPAFASTSLAHALITRAVAARRADSSGESVDSLPALDERVAEAHELFARSLGEATPLGALVYNARLGRDDAEVLAVAATIEADPGLQRLVAYLQDDTTRTRLTLHTLATLFPVEHAGVRTVGPDAPLRRAAFLDVVEDGPWAAHVVVVEPAVMWALAGDTSADPGLPIGVEIGTSSDERDERDVLGGGSMFVAVTGDDRLRRQQEAMRVIAGDRFLLVPRPATDQEWAAVVREATIVGAAVVVELDEELPPDGRRWIERADHLAWALSSRVELPIEQMPARSWIDRHAVASEPSDEEWQAALGDIPRSHRLTAFQLQLVERAHRASGGDLDRAVRRLAGGHIDRMARRIRPTRSWDDIVLAPDRIQLLRELVARYRHADEVYDRWGFSPTPSRGQVALFSGPSGTGKTLAAEIIAGDLGLDLFKLDLSAVVSKYIGETEKNLSRVFDAAQAGNVVLFFDEADALFGKRSEVKDARDRYANIEVSYLLQRLEAYDGLVVLATNFERNIDDAFLRRIHVRVEFALPDEAERKAIWDHNLPGQAPVAADVDTAFLARQFELSGGSIRNAAIQAAFLAAEHGIEIDMARLVGGVGREYQKLGRLLKAEDFGAYFHLVAR
jgi:hypothetical protein